MEPESLAHFFSTWILFAEVLQIHKSRCSEVSVSNSSSYAAWGASEMTKMAEVYEVWVAQEKQREHLASTFWTKPFEPNVS